MKTRIKERTCEGYEGSSVTYYYPQIQKHFLGIPYWSDMAYGCAYYIQDLQAQQHIDNYLKGKPCGVKYTRYPE